MSIVVTYTDNLDGVLNASAEAKRKALNEMGEYAVQMAQNYTPVRTGNLRRSLEHESEGDDTEVYGSDVEYAPFVELGTRKMRAQPYIRPAVDNHRDEYKKIAEEAFKGL